MNLFLEYKNSLKQYWGEELFDLLVHRPLGYLVVKLIQPLPITPNQVTGLSVLASVVAASFIITNNPANLAVAAIFILLGNVLDCADGQLARMRGTGSRYGRIIDGWGDYLSSVILYVAICVWHPPGEIPSLVWVLLVVLTGVSFGWQASLVDFYRNEYSFRLSGRTNFVREEHRQALLDVASAELVEGHSFRLFVLRRYAEYITLQQKFQSAIDAMESVPSTRYVEANSMLSRLWSLNGTATPRFLMALFCVLHRLDFLVVYVLIVGMAWTIVLLALQKRCDKRVRLGTS
jgi:hypothetical protein